MDYSLAVEQVKNPNDKYNLDLEAVRIVLLSLLERLNSIETSVNTDKKGKKK